MIDYIKFWIAKGVVDLAVGLTIFGVSIICIFIMMRWEDRNRKK